jgi:hypothetical protein
MFDADLQFVSALRSGIQVGEKSARSGALLMGGGLPSQEPLIDLRYNVAPSISDASLYSLRRWKVSRNLARPPH